MLNNALSRGLLVLGSVMFVAPIWSTPALAAGAYFRYSHGEPLNDRRVTPGATFNASAAVVCRSGYATSVRNVPQAEKYRVYAEYGVFHHRPYQYEIDHLISLELGGNNSVANLWPEWDDHPHGYLNSKDILENKLHSLVCSGALALRSAQIQISTNWVTTYHKYFGSWPHGGSGATLPTPIAGASPPLTPTPSDVAVTSVIATVAPGSSEVLRARSKKPHDSCNLIVILPSGRQSTATGLGTTSADAAGRAMWTWHIGTRTAAGLAHVTVTCSAGTAHGTFVVT